MAAGDEGRRETRGQERRRGDERAGEMSGGGRQEKRRRERSRGAEMKEIR